MGFETMSVLGAVAKVVGAVGSVGHATFGHSAIAQHFDAKRHRRAVMSADDQQDDSGRVRLDHVPLIYTFNLAGYRPSSLPAGERGRYSLGGFNDATFTVMTCSRQVATPPGRSERLALRADKARGATPPSVTTSMAREQRWTRRARTSTSGA